MPENTLINQQSYPIQTEASDLGNCLFPVFLKLQQMSVLIVGGGNVALEKLLAILHNAPDTNVTVVALIVNTDFREFAQAHSNVSIIEKRFESEDLDPYDIVIAAVNCKQTAEQICQSAHERNLLVNVADTPELCDFYLSSIVKKGDVKIAISTNGKSPTLAKRLKEMLQQTLPEELHSLAQNLHTIRNKLQGDFTTKVKSLNDLTQSLTNDQNNAKGLKWKRVATICLIAFSLMIMGHVIFSYIPISDWAVYTTDFISSLDKVFYLVLLAGFLAQLVDGALGMGYGVTSATVLLSAGVNITAISSSIHTAEMFTSGASGYSHYKFGNVNKKLFKILVIPGVLGAIAGAYLLSRYGDSHASFIRPIMAVYTLFLGLRILANAFRKAGLNRKFKQYRLLALAGGFLDSFAGGGWGPIVTTTLISKGRNPRYVIGTISLTEFFVTLASALTFFALIGLSNWRIILALIIGGLIAAPIAARLTGILPKKVSYILLGLLVIVWSARILIKAL